MMRRAPAGAASTKRADDRESLPPYLLERIAKHASTEQKFQGAVERLEQGFNAHTTTTKSDLSEIKACITEGGREPGLPPMNFTDCNPSAIVSACAMLYSPPCTHTKRWSSAHIC